MSKMGRRIIVMIKKFLNFIKENLGILIIIIFGAVIMEYGFKEKTEDCRIIDGDTVIWNNKKIRLKGIDAPDIKQICSDSRKKDIECGKIAKHKLEEIIGDNELKCYIETNARYIGDLGYCYTEGININREMVKRGYAIAYSIDGKDYIDEEAEAKKLKLGFWAGEFQNPEKWNSEDYKKKMGGIKKVDFLCAGDLEESKALQKCSDKSKEEIDKIKDEYFKYKKILEDYIIKEGYTQFNEKTYKNDISLDINEIAIAVYDINEDGEKEILFNIIEKGYCGSAGCFFEILKKDNKGKWCNLKMPNVDINGIYMSDCSTTLGYKDFIFPDGWEEWSILNVWRWNGKEYDYYKKIYNLTEE
jgi:endonuclease YncB( thermonuclease family)